MPQNIWDDLRNPFIENEIYGGRIYYRYWVKGDVNGVTRWYVSSNWQSPGEIFIRLENKTDEGCLSVFRDENYSFGDGILLLLFSLLPGMIIYKRGKHKKKIK